MEIKDKIIKYHSLTFTV